MNQLRSFTQSLGHHLRQAQHACSGCWPGTRLSSMVVEMAAAVECVGPCGRLALRIGREPRAGEPLYRLCIDVPGRQGEAIAVRIDGDLLGHYRQDSHGSSY